MYLTEDHEIWSVGFNDKGQLALGNHITQSVPQQVMFEAFQKSKVVDIVCGREFNLFLTEDNQLFSCGDNQYGQ
jgi:alpha-tubulin suppressor-like RCC1 family protein